MRFTVCLRDSDCPSSLNGPALCIQGSCQDAAPQLAVEQWPSADAIELIGQGFAAIRSLPTPPTASGESGIDVANLTLYQQALAEHGKTDEQIRTAVHIIGKLLGA